MTDSNEEESEYHINMHVRGKLVHNPHLKYVGRTSVRILKDPDTISYYVDELLTIHNMILC